jgi:UDP-glucuronate decarboxylase
MDDSLLRCPDISKARRLLDWQPRFGLRKGLLRNIAYFDNLLLRSLPSEE